MNAIRRVKAAVPRRDKIRKWDEMHPFVLRGKLAHPGIQRIAQRRAALDWRKHSGAAQVSDPDHLRPGLTQD